MIYWYIFFLLVSLQAILKPPTPSFSSLLEGFGHLESIKMLVDLMFKFICSGLLTLTLCSALFSLSPQKCRSIHYIYYCREKKHYCSPALQLKNDNKHWRLTGLRRRSISGLENQCLWNVKIIVMWKTAKMLTCKMTLCWQKITKGSFDYSV